MREDPSAEVRVQKLEWTEEMISILIAFSREWEKEGSCFGYRTNVREDFEGRIGWLASQGGHPIGYLFGICELAEQISPTVPKGSRIFEVEELFVLPGFRSQGVGRLLFQTMEEELRAQTDFIVLSTATKNAKSILHFYMEELGMTFWSARLFKPL